MISTASTTSVASMTFTASFHQKNTDPDGWIIPSAQMIKTRPIVVTVQSPIVNTTTLFLINHTAVLGIHLSRCCAF